jgi:hypothetical protein
MVASTFRARQRSAAPADTTVGQTAPATCQHAPSSRNGTRQYAPKVSETYRFPQALTALKLLGLLPQAGQLIHQLSGGQQQRTAVARAGLAAPTADRRRANGRTRPRRPGTRPHPDARGSRRRQRPGTGYPRSRGRRTMRPGPRPERRNPQVSVSPLFKHVKHGTSSEVSVVRRAAQRQGCQPGALM